MLAADTIAIAKVETDAELDAQFATLTAEEQQIFDAYLGGINRYISEIALNPLSKLPFEFHALGFFPQPWTRRDSIAFGAFMVRRFGEIGGRELTNLSLLDSLIAAHGPTNGFAIFNDVRWINDPDSPVTVPASGLVDVHTYATVVVEGEHGGREATACSGSRWPPPGPGSASPAPRSRRTGTKRPGRCLPVQPFELRGWRGRQSQSRWEQ